MPKLPRGTTQGKLGAHLVHPDADPVVLSLATVPTVDFNLGGLWDTSLGPPKGMGLHVTLIDEVSIATFRLEAGVINLAGTFATQGDFADRTGNGSFVDYWGDNDTVEDYGTPATIGNHVKAPISSRSVLRATLVAPSGAHAFTITELLLDWWY